MSGICGDVPAACIREEGDRLGRNVGAFIPSRFFPDLFQQILQREHCFPATGVFMTTLRQGSVVLPLEEHSRDEVPYRAP